MAANQITEICPNCGEYVDHLSDFTGWCQKCSNNNTRSLRRQLEEWLSVNADHLEHYISQGHSVMRAVSLVATDVKPVCLSCGGFIHRAPRRNVVFCRRTENCRRSSRRYVYLYTERGLTKAEALSQVITELLT